MSRFAASNSNCAFKDAYTNAPSGNCANNCQTTGTDAAFVKNIAVFTGIAAAVSVFLFVILSIIAYGIIICGISIITFIIISLITDGIILIKTALKNMNIAKLC